MAQVVEQTHVAPEIISLARAKKQLKFDDHEAEHIEDDLIQSYIDAAIGYAENYTGQEITEKKYLINGKSFQDALSFSKQKIQSIDSIKYLDTEGTEQTIATENYQLTTVDKYENAIEFAEDYTLPEVQQYKFNAVKLTVIVGYASGKVPKSMQQAILMLIGHYYENRQDAVKEKCTAAENMLHKYRRY